MGAPTAARLPWVDAYDVLDVPLDATEEDIKKAYKRQSLRYHPDKQGGDQLLFTKLKDAYDVISNGERRKNYDRFGCDLGEKSLDEQVWGISLRILLQPYGSFVFKFCCAGAASYLTGFWILYWLCFLLSFALVLFCAHKCGGLKEFLDPSAFAKLSEGDASEQLKEKAQWQAVSLYGGIFGLFLFLQLLSVWLTDMFFVLVLSLEMAGPLVYNLPRKWQGGLLAGLAISTWLLQDCWYYIYLGLILLLALLGLATLLAVLLVQCWASEAETELQGKVRDQRLQMRLLKSAAGGSSQTLSGVGQMGTSSAGAGAGTSGYAGVNPSMSSRHGATTGGYGTPEAAASPQNQPQSGGGARMRAGNSSGQGTTTGGGPASGTGAAGSSRGGRNNQGGGRRR